MELCGFYQVEILPLKARHILLRSICQQRNYCQTTLGFAGNEHWRLVSGVPTLAYKKFREINVGYSNHNLGIVLVKNYFKVALEWKPVHSLWCCGHMTHTCTHKPVCRDRLTLNFHPHSVAPCILGSGNGAQRSVPAASTGEKVERGAKCGGAPALSRCHGAAGGGSTSW